MPRIFAWNYNSTKNYLIYALFMIAVLSLIGYTLVFIHHISTLRRALAIHKHLDDTTYLVIFKLLGDEEIYIYNCEYPDGRRHYPNFSLQNLSNKDFYKLSLAEDDIVLIKSDLSPICPIEIFYYSIKLILLGFSLLIFIPLGSIVWYDFSQFWKNYNVEKKE